MRTFLIGISSFIAIVGLVFTLAAFAKPQKIELTPTNFVALNTEVDEGSIAAIINAITLSDKTKPYYLYIDSPGGEVFAGFRLVNVLRANPHVVAIANRAFSAAYFILQASPKRIVLENSILMWHSVQAGGRGSTETLINIITLMSKLQAQANKIVADRLGISIAELESRKIPEYWTVGSENIINSNQADESAILTCSIELAKKSTRPNGGTDCPL